MKNYATSVAIFLLGMALAFGLMRFTGNSSPAPITINPPAPTETPGPVTVYINGEVNEPGVYELPLGSRLEQLLEVAGGVTDEADEDGVNIAALLTDGVQVFIANEEDTAVQSASAPERSTINTSTTIDSASNTTTDSGTLININTADRTQLEEIPGVGEATATKILAYREDNGLFLSIEDIMNVSGIGEAKFDAMRNVITVGN